jgi:thiamine pyrophosphokinase
LLISLQNNRYSVPASGSSSIADYYHTFQTLCDAFAVVGQPFNGFEMVFFLLAGLGSDFDHFVTSVTTIAELFLWMRFMAIFSLMRCG